MPQPRGNVLGRNRVVQLVILGLCTGCVESRLTPVKDPVTGDTSDVNDSSGVDTTADSAPCVDVEPETGPSASTSSATCAVDVHAEWDPVITFTSSDDAWFLASPIVLPGGVIYIAQGDGESLITAYGGAVSEMPFPGVAYEDLAGIFGATTPESGSTFIAAALPPSGVADYAAYLYDLGAGTVEQGVAHSSLTNEEVVIADVDADGAPDVATPAGTMKMDGSSLANYVVSAYSMSSLYVDQIDATDPALEVVTQGGVWSDDNVSRQDWEDELFWIGGVTANEDRPFAVYVTWPSLEGRWLDDGSLAWDRAGVDYQYRLAIGDVDGDGQDEICASIHGELTLLDLAGNTLRSWPDDGNRELGSCTLADLDGDGAYEVLDWNEGGFAAFSGATGAILFSIPDFRTGVWPLASPAVADVDGDGSTDIVLTGTEADSFETRPHTVRVYSSASGSWAPTTSVWSSASFAAGTASPDGRPQSRPLVPGWRRGMGFRAQPSLVGIPDPRPIVDSTCVECDEGTAYVSVRVENRGGAPATGVGLHVSAWTDAGWTDYDSASFGDVAESTMSEGQVLTFPFPHGSEITVWVSGNERDCNPDDDGALISVDDCL